LLSSVLLAESLWKQPLESHTIPGWSAKRSQSFKRHLVDPVGPADSIYATVLIVGGRTYRVIMDTGSSTTFLVGLNCTQAGSSSKCQYTTNIFPYQGASSMFDYTYNQCGNNNQITYDGKTNACALRALYADGTHIYGVGVTTTSTFGPYGGDCKIGMGYEASNDFLLAGTDGIWGMTRPNPDYIGVTGPLAAAISNGMPATFAMCLKWRGGGELHLGGYDTNYATSSIQWLLYDTTEAHYVVPMSSISVGSTAISGTSNLKVILDSGSTVAYFPAAVHNSIISAINSACPTCPTSIFDSSSPAATTDPAIWPTITLVFSTGSGTASFALTGAHYLLPASNGQYFGGFYSSSGTDALFGGSMLRNWYTIFDIANNRIGLGPVDIARCTNSLGPAAPLITMTPSTTIPPNPPFAFQSVPDNTAPHPPSGSPTSNPTSAPTVVPNGGQPSQTVPVPSNDASAQVALGPFAIVLSVAVCLFSLL